MTVQYMARWGFSRRPGGGTMCLQGTAGVAGPASFFFLFLLEFFSHV